MLSAGDMFLTMFPWNSVQRKNHEILEAAYRELHQRAHQKENDVTVANQANLGKRQVVQDDKLGYISVYTKQDGSGQFYGIPSTYFYCNGTCQANMGNIHGEYPTEVQLQFDPSNDTYQAVVFNEWGKHWFTLGEEQYDAHRWKSGRMVWQTKEYGDEEHIENICDTPISSALKALGQCQE